ncbi:sulfur carrier protein ThiS [Thioclava atlantica]|uniref:Thiamine biosynthesis protein ThiS n=1 Tax=Thioclava atlantica TaxID=1317124 RepID=A0A085TU17_9RHOB|nr:sulfur carrier protein ThiS [Thioclava atlantica]KFE34214.1 thiamine biosynthesis protein ThiS [Thioclava atlantica]
MRVEVNGKPREVAARDLAALLAELGIAGESVATALDGGFVPRGARAGAVLEPGAKVEILAPMQGG